MAAELERKGSGTKVLALHPGEVETDMAANDLGWEVEGQMSVRESVGMCIRTIEEKGDGESGTFWTWEGEVSLDPMLLPCGEGDIDIARSRTLGSARIPRQAHHLASRTIPDATYRPSHISNSPFASNPIFS